MNFYEVLGVKPNATTREVRMAFGRKARSCNPQAGGDPRQRAILDRAYLVLSTHWRRQAYDTYLNGQAPAPKPPAQPKINPAQSTLKTAANPRDQLRQAAQQSLFDTEYV